jgi:hypothetical protein
MCGQTDKPHPTKTLFYFITPYGPVAMFSIFGIIRCSIFTPKKMLFHPEDIGITFVMMSVNFYKTGVAFQKAVSVVITTLNYMLCVKNGEIYEAKCDRACKNINTHTEQIV